jgi:integrase
MPGQEYVFSVNGRQPVRGYSDAKKLINKRLAEVLPGMQPWVLHDLRRTVVTGMAGIGVSHHVLDRVLNHVSGKIRGTARIYNRHEYLTEREAALDGWMRGAVRSREYPERAQTNVVAMPAR